MSLGMSSLAKKWWAHLPGPIVFIHLEDFMHAATKPDSIVWNRLHPLLHECSSGIALEWMALVAMMARLNAPVFYEILAEILGADFKFVLVARGIDAGECLVPALQVGYHVDTQWPFVELALKDWEKNTSIECFCRASASMCADMGIEDPKIILRDLVVPWKVYLDKRSQDPRKLKFLAQLVNHRMDTTMDQPSNMSRQRPLFSLVECDVCFSARIPLDLQIVPNCLPMHAMRFMDGSDAKECSMLEVWRLQRLFACRGIPDDIVEQCGGGIREVTIDVIPKRIETMKVLSLIPDSTTLESLIIYGSNNDRNWGEWLAFLLLDPVGSKSLRQVTMESSMITSAFLNALAQISSGNKNRHSELEFQGSSHACVQVARGTPVLVEKYRTQRSFKDQTSWCLPYPLTVRVLEDEPGESMLKMLLPGRGLAWIKRDAVIGRSAIPPRRKQISKLALTINCNLHIEMVLEFLNFVGAQLHFLDLRRPETMARGDRTISPDKMNEVLRACPRLRVLQTDVEDIPPIIQAFTSGDCGVTRLVLDCEKLEHERLQALFVALGDPLHPIASKLQVLRLNVRHCSQYLQDEYRCYSHCVTMLQANDHLVGCQICTYDRFAPQHRRVLFAAQNGRQVRVATRRGLQARLVFMLMARYQYRVPADAVEVIFSFVLETSTRWASLT